MRSFIFINRKSSSNKAQIAISNLVKASNNKLHTLNQKKMISFSQFMMIIVKSLI